MIGILIGVISSLAIGFIFYWLPKKSQEKLDKFMKDSLSRIDSHNKASFSLLVSVKNDNLRTSYQGADEGSKSYWHFKLRFETCDILGLNTKENNEFVKVRILSTTNDFRSNKFGMAYEHYVCEIVESKSAQFPEGSQVACVYENGRKFLVHKIGKVVPVDEKVEFDISTLGNGSFGSGDGDDIDKVKTFSRMKDYYL